MQTLHRRRHEARYVMQTLREELGVKSNAEVARERGVADTTVRKWRRLLEIPYPSPQSYALHQFLVFLISHAPEPVRGAAIARMLGMSRQSVNEAFHRLLRDGLVEKHGSHPNNVSWTKCHHANGKGDA